MGKGNTSKLYGGSGNALQTRRWKTERPVGRKRKRRERKKNEITCERSVKREGRKEESECEKGRN